MRPPPNQRLAKHNTHPARQPRGQDDSGWRWGPFELTGDRPWSLKADFLGGQVSYPYPDFIAKQSQHISQCTGTGAIICKGNHVQHFTHPGDYVDREWYYWDNCLLPQFMMPNPANPRGEKVWTRLVYKSPFPGRYRGTDDQLRDREQKINDMLSEQAKTAMTWQDLCLPSLKPRHTRPCVLLCLCSEQMPQLYYGVSLKEIQQAVDTVCQKRGWQLITRPKPSRKARLGDQSIGAWIDQYQPMTCIGIHSAIGAECLALGVPYVSMGLHALDTLATTWHEFQRGEFRQPQRRQVERRFLELLCVSRNKTQELLTGTWSLDRYEQNFEPLTEWRIDL